MISRYLTRTRLLLVLGLLAVAGVSVPTVNASEDWYCFNCTLQSNGVPAVSAARYHISNGMELTDAADWHYFLYNVSTGNQTCDRDGSNSFGSYFSCANSATARCHLINGTGPRLAKCRSEY
jgi:hypothetical protein